MILDRHPDVPDLSAWRAKGYLHAALSDTPKFIGYWYSERYAPDLPHPEPFVDLEWDTEERARVVAYLQRGETLISWRGSAACRFECGERLRGYRCFTDGEWVWPEDFAHYVDKHGVKPPEVFIAKALV